MRHEIKALRYDLPFNGGRQPETALILSFQPRREAGSQALPAWPLGAEVIGLEHPANLDPGLSPWYAGALRNPCAGPFFLDEYQSYG